MYFISYKFLIFPLFLSFSNPIFSFYNLCNHSKYDCIILIVFGFQNSINYVNIQQNLTQQSSNSSNKND